MRIRHELRYDAPPDKVYAMLGDRAFRDRVCSAMGVARHDVTIDLQAEGMEVSLDMDQRTHGLPSFARRIVGDTTRVIQSETWRGHQADLRVRIPGKPGDIAGRTTLRSEGEGTVESFDGEAHIRVPLVGGRLEGLIEKLFIAGMDTEQTVGARWLEGDRT
jgi:hypothetical protein